MQDGPEKGVSVAVNVGYVMYCNCTDLLAEALWGDSGWWVLSSGSSRHNLLL